LIWGFPNGETHGGKPSVRPDESIVGCEQTQGSEPSQYLEENKSNRDSEIGRRLGVSRERARQLEARAKKKLKSRITELSRGNGWLDVHDAA